MFLRIFLFFLFFLSQTVFCSDFQRRFSNNFSKEKHLKILTFRESLIEKINQKEKKHIIDNSLIDVYDASDILESLDGLDGRGVLSDDESEDIPEYVFNDKNGNIRRFSYDGEQMLSQKIFLEQDGIQRECLEIVSLYKDKIKNTIYDEKSRIVSVEILSLSEKAKDMKSISKREYFYKENSDIPYKSAEEVSEKNMRIEVTFNEEGLLIVQDEYFVDFETEKRTLKKRINKSYDKEKRVIKDEQIVWHDDKSKTKQKKNFEYTKYSKNPDFSYFENDVLRLQRNYEADEDFFEKTFFDDGFSIESYFENGVRQSEIVYFNGKEVRRRYFNE